MQPPSATEQQQILERVWNYASRYMESLPNFTCDQVTRQFEAGEKPTHWRKLDTLTSRLVFNDGKEQRILQFVNNKPLVKVRHSPPAPLTSEGEFGTLLGQVFDSATETKFSWSGWESVADKTFAVFSFAVDKQHSTLRISLGDSPPVTVAYKGSVAVDSTTGAIWRITDGADDIPDAVETRSIATSVEYEDVVIAGKSYLLPAFASVHLDTGRKNIRNDLEFKEYRKFETNSTITFAQTDTPSSRRESSANF